MKFISTLINLIVRSPIFLCVACPLVWLSEITLATDTPIGLDSVWPLTVAIVLIIFIINLIADSIENRRIEQKKQRKAKIIR